jgi:hypothetical protein
VCRAWGEAEFYPGETCESETATGTAKLGRHAFSGRSSFLPIRVAIKAGKLKLPVVRQAQNLGDIFTVEIYLAIVVEGTRSKPSVGVALTRIPRDPNGGLQELKPPF